MNENTVSSNRKVLTFSLGGEVYGVDILRVKEIRGWSPVTRIPQSAPAVLGVLNLRGVVVPIVDMRVRFGLRSAEFNAVTVVIVLSLPSETGSREFGIVVDQVNDVVDLAPEHIRPAPDTGGLNPESICGIATSGEQMIVLLNAERLVCEAPAQVADQAA
jgi:purine-binding chemotaxis protein CheW